MIHVVVAINLCLVIVVLILQRKESLCSHSIDPNVVTTGMSFESIVNESVSLSRKQTLKSNHKTPREDYCDDANTEMTWKHRKETFMMASLFLLSCDLDSIWREHKEIEESFYS